MCLKHLNVFDMELLIVLNDLYTIAIFYML